MFVEVLRSGPFDAERLHYRTFGYISVEEKLVKNWFSLQQMGSI